MILRYENQQTELQKCVQLQQAIRLNIRENRLALARPFGIRLRTILVFCVAVTVENVSAYLIVGARVAPNSILLIHERLEADFHLIQI